MFVCVYIAMVCMYKRGFLGFCYWIGFCLHFLKGKIINYPSLFIKYRNLNIKNISFLH